MLASGLDHRPDVRLLGLCDADGVSRPAQLVPRSGGIHWVGRYVTGTHCDSFPKIDSLDSQLGINVAFLFSPNIKSIFPVATSPLDARAVR